MTQEWMPIETAPKDGQKVLAAFKGQFDWVIFVGYATANNGVFCPNHARPTHWMPLPPPPKD